MHPPGRFLTARKRQDLDARFQDRVLLVSTLAGPFLQGNSSF